MLACGDMDDVEADEDDDEYDEEGDEEASCCGCCISVSLRLLVDSSARSLFEADAGLLLSGESDLTIVSANSSLTNMVPLFVLTGDVLLEVILFFLLELIMDCFELTVLGKSAVLDVNDNNIELEFAFV